MTRDRASLAAVFADLARLQVAPFGVQDIAQRLVDGAVDTLEVSAAGVLLAVPDGPAQVLAASTHEVALLELVQVTSGEGPCLAAIDSNSTVVVADLAQVAERWPSWVAGAGALGIRTAYGVPMHADGVAVGALNLFRDDGGVLDADELAVAGALADAATVAITQHRALAAADDVGARLQQALESRVVIEQAKGLLAERSGVSVAEAFAALRAHARAARLPLAEVADAVLAGRLRLP